MNLTVYLKHPYSASLVQFQELSSIWNIQIVKASTRSRIVKISMSNKTYERIFCKKPIIGEVNLPEVLQSFIDRMIVEKK